MDILKLVLVALLSVVALFVITKMMGHKQVAQLDFFDYVSGITIGSIGAELATELEEPHKPLIALLVYGAVSMLLSLAARKLPFTRKYINGTPTILLNGGKIYRENLKKAKLDLSDFMMLCRESGYFDLEEIETAILEYNGRLSVLPKSSDRPAAPKDLGITPRAAHIATELIMDGRVMGENLHRMGRDENWLSRKLSSLGYGRKEDITLALYRADEDKLTVFQSEKLRP